MATEDLMVRRPAWLLGAPTVAGILALAATAWVLHVSPATLEIPWRYESDALLTTAAVKMVAANGLPVRSNQLGLPFGLDLTSFPQADAGHLTAVRAFEGLGLTPFQVVNTYFMATFFLTAAIACIVLMQLNIEPILATSAAFVYALLPSHFFRSIGHLWLAGYFFVPASIYVLLRYDAPRRSRWDSAALWAVCAATPLFGIYYAFFFCYLLVALMLLRGTGAPLKRGAVCLLLTVTSTLASLAPSLLFLARGGSAKAVMARDPAQVETLGLRLTGMLLPAWGIVSEWLSAPFGGAQQPEQDWLRDAARAYQQTAPLRNENVAADSGFVVSLALVGVTVALLARALRPERRNADGDLSRLGVLGLFTFVFGTMGGLATLIAYLGFPFIRAANRISVYLAFLVLVGACSLVQAVLAPRPRPWRTVGLAVVGLGMCIVTVGEIRTRKLAPDYGRLAAQYQADAAFFSELEMHLRPGSRILQLPYIAFPEGGWNGRASYESIIPYLYTTSPSWSFGATKGTDGEIINSWLDALATQDAAMLQHAANSAGYNGILVHRALFREERLSKDEVLSTSLGAPTRVSSDGSYAYYALPDAEPEAPKGAVSLVRSAPAPTQAPWRAKDFPHAVDVITESRDRLILQGWMCDPEEDMRRARPVIVLLPTDGGAPLLKQALPQVRYDVRNALPAQPYGELCGFATIIEKSTVPPGVYEVRFGFERSQGLELMPLGRPLTIPHEQHALPLATRS